MCKGFVLSAITEKKAAPFVVRHAPVVVLGGREARRGRRTKTEGTGKRGKEDPFPRLSITAPSLGARRRRADPTGRRRRRRRRRRDRLLLTRGGEVRAAAVRARRRVARGVPSPRRQVPQRRRCVLSRAAPRSPRRRGSGFFAMVAPALRASSVTVDRKSTYSSERTLGAWSGGSRGCGVSRHVAARRWVHPCDDTVSR